MSTVKMESSALRIIHRICQRKSCFGTSRITKPAKVILFTENSLKGGRRPTPFVQATLFQVLIHRIRHQVLDGMPIADTFPDITGANVHLRSVKSPYMGVVGKWGRSRPMVDVDLIVPQKYFVVLPLVEGVRLSPPIMRTKALAGYFSRR